MISEERGRCSETVYVEASEAWTKQPLESWGPSESVGLRLVGRWARSQGSEEDGQRQHVAGRGWGRKAEARRVCEVR